jgi:hypothetical protein
MKFDMKPITPPSREAIRERIDEAKIIAGYTHLIITRWSATKKEIGTAVFMRTGQHLLAPCKRSSSLPVRTSIRKIWPLSHSAPTFVRPSGAKAILTFP